MQRRTVPALAWFALAISALFWGFRLDSSRLAGGEVYEEPGSAYGFLASNASGPSVWDCTAPIKVVVNDSALPSAARETFRADLAAAFASISSVSPFEFLLVGTTSKIPSRSWGSSWDDEPHRAPVIVAVAPAASSDLVKEHGAAAGGSFYRETPSGSLVSYAGYVMVELEDFGTYRPGSGRMSHQALLLHELLHVLNLGHVHDSSSVLTPLLSASDGDLGPGDVAGLSVLAARGCPGR